MTERPPYRSPAEERGSGGSVAYLDQALWRQLVEAQTDEEFCHSWLGLLCRMIGEVESGVVVMGPPEMGPFTPVAFWPKGLKERAHLAGVIERAITERKGVVTRSDADADPDSEVELRFLLAYPVWGAGKVHGVAALEIAPRPQVRLQSAMRQLQWGVPWLENRILRREAGPEGVVRQKITTALDLAAVSLQEERFRSAATAFVTELATRLSCDRVSIGFLKGKQVKVRALSHSAQFGKQMNLIRAIGAAMDESIDQQSILVYPDPPDGKHAILRAHEDLARQHEDGAICTIPLRDRDGKGYGALTLERSVPQPFDPGTVQLCESTAALVGPILEEKRKNDRFLIVKVGDSLWAQVKKVVGPGHSAVKLVIAGILALAVFFAFAKGDYRVTANSTLEGTVQRVVVAPYRGYIETAPARAGDIVRKGQVLAVLDERDLRLERIKWESKRDQYRLEHRKAMAKGETAATKILKEQINQAEAEIALLDEQLTRARIISPFDGVVVKGDLSQSLGSPVEQGQVLFEVAPLDAYRLMLKVDERDIRQVRLGQRGELVLTALPRMRLPFTVTRLTPVSLAEEGKNHFLVESRLEEASDRLRPGMEGYGKVTVDRRRLIWIWTHDIVDWVRLWAWTWLP